MAKLATYLVLFLLVASVMMVEVHSAKDIVKSTPKFLEDLETGVVGCTRNRCFHNADCPGRGCKCLRQKGELTGGCGMPRENFLKYGTA